MWKGLLVGICIIIPIILYIMIYLNSILNNQYDENFMAIYRFFCFFLIINIIICAFSIIYYYYKIDIPGNKGPGGDKGDIGNQGQNKSCEICEKRDNKFSKIPKNSELDEFMDNSSVEDFKIILKNLKLNTIIVLKEFLIDGIFILILIMMQK